MSTAALGTIAERLAYLVDVSGLDFKSVDTLAGLKSRNHTGQIVRGKKPSPSAVTVVALAIVFGTSAEWLTLGDDAKRRRRAPSRRRVREAVRAAGGVVHAPRVRTGAQRRKAARPRSASRSAGRARARA